MDGFADSKVSIRSAHSTRRAALFCSTENPKQDVLRGFSVARDNPGLHDSNEKSDYFAL